MTSYTHISIPFLLLLVFVKDEVKADVCPDDELYVIRSSGSGGSLVLDGSEPPRITLQYFTGYSPQLWQFKRGSKAGLYYIINNYTANALDFVKTDHLDLVMSKRKERLQQQWSLTLKGRIVNAANSWNVDVTNENYNSGTRISVVEENGRKAQEFNWDMLSVRVNVDGCKYWL